MKRYKYIEEKEIFESWNKLRDALLAAKNGTEVNEIMKSLFTDEEKFQLGRRIIIAEALKMEMTIIEICNLLKVGRNTVSSVIRKLERYPEGFNLIEKRSRKVEEEYKKKKYKEKGGSKLVYKKREYTGITRKDIER